MSAKKTPGALAETAAGVAELGGALFSASRSAARAARPALARGARFLGRWAVCCGVAFCAITSWSEGLSESFAPTPAATLRQAELADQLFWTGKSTGAPRGAFARVAEGPPALLVAPQTLIDLKDTLSRNLSHSYASPTLRALASSRGLSKLESSSEAAQSALKTAIAEITAALDAPRWTLSAGEATVAVLASRQGLAWVGSLAPWASQSARRDSAFLARASRIAQKAWVLSAVPGAFVVAHLWIIGGVLLRRIRKVGRARIEKDGSSFPEAAIAPRALDEESRAVSERAPSLSPAAGEPAHRRILNSRGPSL